MLASERYCCCCRKPLAKRDPRERVGKMLTVVPAERAASF